MRCPICDNKIVEDYQRKRKDLCHECDESISNALKEFYVEENEEDEPPLPEVWEQ